jgi:leucyl/phenylalanyl-tRNA---protein transferase
VWPEATAIKLPWLAIDDAFPHPDRALAEPAGLLCAGADLSVARLRSAYANGIFPWFNEAEPILWWSPDPRFVLLPEDFYLSKRDWRTLRGSGWQVRSDSCFMQVLNQCAAPRANYPGAGTWLSAPMQAAYGALHQAGHAHSVEVFDGAELIGGIYGVASGGVFCGESMFGTRANASKAALAALVLRLGQQGFTALDCQIYSEHLAERGAQQIQRSAFLRMLASATPAADWVGGFWPDALGQG